MSTKDIPGWYGHMRKRYAKLMDALEALGRAARQEGPLDEKTAHLIQLAAASSTHSQGAVHSHVRRALDAGATPQEIRHAIILLTSTVGFPCVSAALSWAQDVLGDEEG